MKHYGDITKLNGYDLPIVDVISGGSPCQDLSVAGCRKGLSGERSSLFLEQIRIVKEMREHDAERLRNRGADVDFRLLRPRWLVWENVPGAFSSPGKVNGEDHTGEDFQIVLKEIIKIVEPDAPDVPLPEGRKWNKSGCIYDEMGRWSIAWTQHDAQYWSVPQRRKRIALVADFNGLCAPPQFYLTINTTEKPTEEMPSHLSEILQEQTHSRYRLSAKACRGILNRAAKRGKILPEILKQALENQIQRTESSTYDNDVSDS